MNKTTKSNVAKGREYERSIVARVYAPIDPSSECVGGTSKRNYPADIKTSATVRGRTVMPECKVSHTLKKRNMSVSATFAQAITQAEMHSDDAIPVAHLNINTGALCEDITVLRTDDFATLLADADNLIATKKRAAEAAISKEAPAKSAMIGFDNLTYQQQQVVEMRHRGMGFTAIARKLNIVNRTAEMLFKRAVETMHREQAKHF